MDEELWEAGDTWGAGHEPKATEPGPAAPSSQLGVLAWSSFPSSPKLPQPPPKDAGMRLGGKVQGTVGVGHKAEYRLRAPQVGKGRDGRWGHLILGQGRADAGHKSCGRGL